MFNKAILAGKVTIEPTRRTTQTGGSLVSFGLATTHHTPDANGGLTERIEYHTVVVWGNVKHHDLADLAADLKKGATVFVEGRISSRAWDGQDGQKRRTTEIVASSIEPLTAGQQPRRVSGSFFGGMQ